MTSEHIETLLAQSGVDRAAIALTLRRRKDVKKQNPAEQVRVRRADSVELVSMPPDRDQ